MAYNVNRVFPAVSPKSVRVRRIAVPKHLPRHTRYTFGQESIPWTMPFIVAVHKMQGCYAIVHRMHDNALIVGRPPR